MKKILKIIISAAIILTLGVIIMIPQILKTNPSLFEDNKYEKEDLDEICGVELRQREENFEDVKCIKLWNNRNVETQFDILTFYLFDSSKKAEEALNSLSKNSKDFILDEGPDFIKMKDPGTIDASSVSYYYLNNNLIVHADLYVTSEWAVNPFAGSDDDLVYKPDEAKIISLITKYFTK